MAEIPPSTSFAGLFIGFDESPRLELKITNSYTISLHEHNTLPASVDHMNISPIESCASRPTNQTDGIKQPPDCKPDDFTKMENQLKQLPSPCYQELDLPDIVNGPKTPGYDNTSGDSGLSVSFSSDDWQNDQKIIFDVDLQATSLEIGGQEECLEADQLTSTLPPGYLTGWQLMCDVSSARRDIDDIEALWQPIDAETSYTGIKDRTKLACMNHESAKVEASPEYRESEEADCLPCVNYSDVHLPQICSSDSGRRDQQLIGNDTSGSGEVLERPQSQRESTAKEYNEKATGNTKALKRPKNGFIRFAMKFRKKVADNHPRMDNREISRILGIRWRKLPEDEKKAYEVEFQSEMNARKMEHPEWRYGGVRQYVDPAALEPIPSRLRPRNTLKRIKIQKLKRSYKRRGKNALVHLTWVQCDRCDKWRQLPYGISTSNIPEKWYCELNWAPKNHCDADEDQDDPDCDEIVKTQGMDGRPQYSESNNDQYSLKDYVTF